jgi:hypothetical protein
MSAPEYYACLEQGRARNPSGEILEALARALVLDAAEREHLNDLCTHAGSVPGRAGPRHTLGTFGHVSAFILGRHADVLGTKLLTCAMLTDFGGLPAVKHTLACGCASTAADAWRLPW